MITISASKLVTPGQYYGERNGEHDFSMAGHYSSPTSSKSSQFDKKSSQPFDQSRTGDGLECMVPSTPAGQHDQVDRGELGPRRNTRSLEVVVKMIMLLIRCKI